MSNEDEFDTIPTGSWIRGRDLIDHWVLFVVKNVEKREGGTFGDETVVHCDFADLTTGEGLKKDCLISDKHIASKLVAGRKIVGRVSQTPPKQKGWQGAIYLEQPAGEGYEEAKKKARIALAAPPKEDDLEDLLA